MCVCARVNTQVHTHSPPPQLPRTHTHAAITIATNIHADSPGSTTYKLARACAFARAGGCGNGGGGVCISNGGGCNVVGCVGVCVQRWRLQCWRRRVCVCGGCGGGVWVCARVATHALVMEACGCGVSGGGCTCVCARVNKHAHAHAHTRHHYHYNTHTPSPPPLPRASWRDRVIV